MRPAQRPTVPNREATGAVKAGFRKNHAAAVTATLTRNTTRPHAVSYTHLTLPTIYSV